MYIKAVLEKKCAVSPEMTIISSWLFLRMCRAAVIPLIPFPIIKIADHRPEHCYQQRYDQHGQDQDADGDREPAA